MTRLICLQSLLAVASVFMATAVSAHDHHGTFVGARVGSMNIDSERYYSHEGERYDYRSDFSAYGFGLQLGHRFENNIVLRSYYDRTRASISEYDSSATGHSYGVDVLYHFDPVYIGIGANSSRYHQEKGAFWRATLGYEAQLRDRFSLSFELAVQKDDSFLDQYAGLSLNYRLGRDMRTQVLPRKFRQ